MTRVYIPIGVRGPLGFDAGSLGYYLRQPGDDRDGPLIVEPGVRAYERPKETDMKLGTWLIEWRCKCGFEFRTNPGDWDLFERSPTSRSRFMTFGFHSTCPGCGADIGDDGPEDQVDCLRVRYNLHRDVPYHWWKPSTWRATIVRELKDD